MTKVRIQRVGEDPKKIEQDLNEFLSDAPQILKDKVLQLGLRVEKHAKRLCPVDTGRLRSSIEARRINRNTVFVGTWVNYAEYVEFGTMRNRPRPFLRPAAEIALKGFGHLVATDMVRSLNGR